MRWPPVTLTIGTAYLSATSAMRRSWSGVVTPPFICGTTEKVPSRWMLPCTRSLVNRASRSSTISSVHRVRSREARPILLLASSSPRGARAANTADTDFSSCSRMAAMRSGFDSGMPGTYQDAEGSSSAAPPRAASRISLIEPLHDPQPLPARVLSMSAVGVCAPALTAVSRAPLLTPLQLHTWASSGRSAALTCAPPPMS